MADSVLTFLTVLAAVGCGLVAGVFFAFSNFVMRALMRLPAPQGIAAMQSINIVVINPLFMTVLFGTALVCVVLAVVSVVNWREAGSGLAVVGSVLYGVGTVGVTLVCNVPLNNALAAVNPVSEDAAAVWTNYAKRWTVWNHARTAAALIAAAVLIYAARLT